jgi:cytochrome c oxidase subunit IV
MAHTEHTAAGHHSHGHHHIVPKKILYTVFGALIFLTVLTVVTATQLDIGAFNLPLALAIAGTKAILVVLFFMALKWDSPVNRLVAGMGVCFVAIFLTFTLFDTLFRGDFGNVDAMTIQDIERQQEELRAREGQMLQVSPGDFQADSSATAPEAAPAAGAASEPAPAH